MRINGLELSPMPTLQWARVEKTLVQEGENLTQTTSIEELHLTGKFVNPDSLYLQDFVQMMRSKESLSIESEMLGSQKACLKQGHCKIDSQGFYDYELLLELL